MSHRRRHRPLVLGSFSADARTAMRAAPEYFVWWYSAKSLLLVASLAFGAFNLGRMYAAKKEQP
jgi:hypothetical protein